MQWPMAPLRPSECRTKLIFYLIIHLNKIWYYWAYCSAFLNKFKSDSWELWSPCGGTRSAPRPAVLSKLFWRLSGGRGWALSSQLLLSVLDLWNSKSWWARNLALMNRQRLPSNNWLGFPRVIYHRRTTFRLCCCALEGYWNARRKPNDFNVSFIYRKIASINAPYWLINLVYGCFYIQDVLVNEMGFY